MTLCRAAEEMGQAEVCLCVHVTLAWMLLLLHRELVEARGLLRALCRQLAARATAAPGDPAPVSCLNLLVAPVSCLCNSLPLLHGCACGQRGSARSSAAPAC